MEAILSLAGVVGAISIGAMSPGPSFVLVARTAMVSSRKNALFTALGMGLGAVVFAELVLFGLQAVIAEVPRLYLALKVGGGIYLIYIASRLWRCANEPGVMPGKRVSSDGSAGGSFFLGLFTQLSNPKTAVVYGSVFAALLPHHMARFVTLVLPFLIFAVETGWYAIVAIALSAGRSRDAYLRSKHYIDRIAGGIMAVLGIRLITAARRTIVT